MYDLIANVRYFEASVNIVADLHLKTVFSNSLHLKDVKKIAKITQNTQRLFNTVINYVYSSKI